MSIVYGSLPDRTLPVVRAGRRMAESLMIDVIVVRRPTGETVTDPDTFKVVPAYETIYSPLSPPHMGRAKMQTYEGHETTLDVAGSTAVVQRSTVQVPVGAFRSRPGDVVTVLVSSSDPLLAGKSFRVVQDYPVKTHATAYRIFVDENVGEEVPEWQP